MGTDKEDRNGCLHSGASGKFKAKGDGSDEAKESLERIYNSDYAGNDLGNKRFPKIPKAVEFSRSNTKHHIDHAKEMGLNMRQYVQAAIEFFNSGEGDLYFSERRQCFYKYESKTKIFAVMDREGIVHTFRLVSGREFERTKRQDKLYERNSQMLHLRNGV